MLCPAATYPRGPNSTHIMSLSTIQLGAIASYPRGLSWPYSELVMQWSWFAWGMECYMEETRFINQLALGWSSALLLCSSLYKVKENCAWMSQWSFLNQFLFEIDTNCSLDSLTTLARLSYSILIPNWYKLLPWSFVIQFLFKINTNCTLDSLAAYCYGLYGIVFHSVGYWRCRCVRVSFDIL